MMMKYFKGTIKEIPGISADNFQGINLSSSAFFLSHVHADHTPGLKTAEFHDALIKPNVYLYSSPITTKIIQEWCPNLKHKFIYLETNTPRIIEIPNNNSVVTVTTIPAEHCPGSIMFLFSFNGKNIIYTGDFRYEVDDLHKFKKYFYNGIGELIKVDKIYLDVTFLRKIYYKFPSRQAVIDEMCRLITEWIELSENHIIHIKNSATYGSEFLYSEIWNRLKIPVHVTENVYSVLKYIPELQEALEINCNITQINAHFKMQKCSGCNNPHSYIRTIIPSAMFWINWNQNNLVELVNSETYRVCYSCHASCDELLKFLTFLKPRQIRANVPPVNELEIDEMNSLISDCIKSYSEEESCEEDAEPENEIIQFKIGIEDTVNSTDYEDLGELFDSPPSSPFKRRRI